MNVQLKVQIVPGARRSEVVGWHGERLKLKVKAPPVEGKANVELCRFVADLLELRTSDVTVTAGAKSRQKTLQLRRITPEVLAIRLRAAVPAT